MVYSVLGDLLLNRDLITRWDEVMCLVVVSSLPGSREEMVVAADATRLALNLVCFWRRRGQ